MQLEDRARGTMLGLGLGDALGVITEGLNPEQIYANFGFIKDFNGALIIDKMIQNADDERSINALQRSIARWPLPGLYSDDTQQALVIADCLIQCKKIDADYIASTYLKMASCPGQNSFGLFRGVGPGFTTTVNNLKQGKPHAECGAISAGNGAAMRIAPVGIYFHHNYDLLEQAIIDASLLTHRDIRGIAAAGVIAFTVAYIMDHNVKYLNYRELLAELIIFIRGLERHLSLDYPTVLWEDFTVNQVSKSIEMLEGILDCSHNEAIKELDTLAAIMSKDSACKHNHPFALGSVIYSLYLFIKQGRDPEQAILTAVNGGGDTDTIGAMAGALCGALHGTNSWPPSWQEQLFNREQIAWRGEALVNDRFDSALLKDLFEMEKAACKAEDLFRRQYFQALQKKFGF